MLRTIRPRREAVLEEPSWCALCGYGPGVCGADTPLPATCADSADDRDKTSEFRLRPRKGTPDHHEGYAVWHPNHRGETDNGTSLANHRSVPFTFRTIVNRPAKRPTKQGAEPCKIQPGLKSIWRRSGKKPVRAAWNGRRADRLADR